MPELIDVPPGLAGVAVADTEIGDVLGEQGHYHYRGIPALRLAREADFETAAALVLGGSADRLQGDRSLPTTLGGLVGSIDVPTGLSALGGALHLASLPDTPAEQRLEQAVRLIAVSPTLVPRYSTAGRSSQTRISATSPTSSEWSLARQRRPRWCGPSRPTSCSPSTTVSTTPRSPHGWRHRPGQIWPAA